MGFDNFFDRKNRKTCRWFGGFFTAIPSLYILSGGFVRGFEGIGGWFRQWFVVGLSLMFFLGIIFLIVGFSKKHND